MIVDMQEVLMPVVWQGPELADRIAALANRARGRGVPVIALQQIGEPGTMFDPARPETRLTARLGLRAADTVIQKTATDGFYRTNLKAVLEGIDTIVLAGVASDYCVDATARAAVSHGFDVVLVEDGHSTTNDPEAGLTAEQIVARHNRLLTAAIHPGGTVKARPAAKIFD